MGGKQGNFWGKLIQELRDERGLSQRKLADASHVNRSTLRRIEDGTARGDIDVIERLLSHMDYELEAMHNAAVEAKRMHDLESQDCPLAKSKAAMMRLLQLTANPMRGLLAL